MLKTGVPFDEELIVINAKPSFLKQHPAAVKAFLSDMSDVTKYLAENQGRQAGVAGCEGLVAMPPDIYMNVKPYATDIKLRPNMENMVKQQEVLQSEGFVEKKVDLGSFVDTSYLPQ